MKEETRIDGPWEEGDWEAGGQGARTDIKKITDAVIDGFTDMEIIEKFGDRFLTRYKGIDRVRTVTLEERVGRSLREVKVYIYWGVPGSGKTYSVYEQHGFDDVYSLPESKSDAIWFDGYTGQDVLLIDEFDSQIPYRFMLKLLDKYPLRIQVKGGFTWAGWTKVYITSNIAPKTWWFGGTDGAFWRRITDVKEFNETYG